MVLFYFFSKNTMVTTEDKKKGRWKSFCQFQFHTNHSFTKAESQNVRQLSLNKSALFAALLKDSFVGHCTALHCTALQPSTTLYGTCPPLHFSALLQCSEILHCSALYKGTVGDSLPPLHTRQVVNRDSCSRSYVICHVSMQPRDGNFR